MLIYKYAKEKAERRKMRIVIYFTERSTKIRRLMADCPRMGVDWPVQVRRGERICINPYVKDLKGKLPKNCLNVSNWIVYDVRYVTDLSNPQKLICIDVSVSPDKS